MYWITKLALKKAQHRNTEPKLNAFDRENYKGEETQLNLGHSKEKKKILQILNGHRQHDSVIHKLKKKYIIQIEEKQFYLVLCNCQVIPAI